MAKMNHFNTNAHIFRNVQTYERSTIYR